MASLGLGWVGEPAVADLLRPLFQWMGIQSPTALHSASFTVAFVAITAIHIVIGEQVPKMMAILKPEFTVLTCSLPLKIFFLLTYPFMWLLNRSADFLLRLIGLEAGEAAHETPFTEDELRRLLAGAQRRGELTHGKHQLLDAIFAMDVQLTRQIMVPRTEVIFFTLAQSVEECITVARRTKHTRFPLCEDSLDSVKGVIHIKDLVVHPDPTHVELEDLARQPRFVPETLPVSRLLKTFQATKQHLAFVLDEHGAVQGMVTLENVLEELVGEVQDEFDEEDPLLVPNGSGTFIVDGLTPIEDINERLRISLDADRVDTISGLLFAQAGRVLKAGDHFDLGPIRAEVLEVRSARAVKIRLLRNLPE